MPSFRGHRGLVGGALILAIGVILLLDQEGVVSASHVFAVFWPFWLILFGLEDLVAGLTDSKRMWGGFVTLAGILLLLNNLHYIHVRFAILWPLVLIGLGIWLLLAAQGHAPRVWPPPHGWHQPWIRRGPGGPMGSQPGGPGYPPGAPGPPAGAPGSAFGGPGAAIPPASAPAATAGSNAASGDPQAPPTPNPSNPWGASAPPQPGQGQPQAGQPTGMPPSQGPFPYAAQVTEAPPNFSSWHDWRVWQKQQARDLKRQMRAWKHGWNPQANWQQQNWPGQDANSAPNYGANAGAPAPNGNNDSQFNYSVIFSHVERYVTSKNFKSGTLSAIFGGFEIDLSRADIEGDEAVIYADAFFGGGEIRIPPTWHVVIEGNALFGAFMDETRQLPPTTTPAKKLIIRGTAVFGGVSIEN